jgi:small subunit ribosomal protein S6
MKRNYELALILDPQLGDKPLEEVIEKYDAYLKANGAEVANLDRWGLRKLAYTTVTMKRRPQGFYVLYQFVSEAGLLPKMQQVLKLDEGVLRFLFTAVQGEFIRVPQLLAEAAMQAREDRGPRGGGREGRYRREGPEGPPSSRESAAAPAEEKPAVPEAAEAEAVGPQAQA